MKKTQKGVTLVEVIVAIAVFAIISLALFSSVFAMKNVVARQEEYLKLEMVCQDIKANYKKDPNTWYGNYFKGYAVNDGKEGYLDAKFTPSTFDNAVYLIKITDEGFFSIYSADEKTMYVENVKLGGSN